MERFLQFNKRKVDAGDLSLRTLNDYLYEIPKFASFMRVSTPIESLRSEHFSAYMAHLVSNRKLGRYARRRVRVYVNVMLNYGVKNGWMVRPPTGSDWVAPATDRESMRVARMRAGIADNENRIFTGDEFDRIFNVATPAWRAMLLVAVNCGLGPADIGRLRWKHLSLKTGRLDFPRGKTGVARVGYLWKRTRQALRKVRRLKRSLAAIARDGENALVFWSERGNPMYVETPQLALFQVDGREVKKLTHVRISGPIPCTFARLAKLAKLKGLSFYRLRHTTKTLGKAARDSEALDLIMGHANNSIGKLYDHTEIEFRRVKRVAIAIKHGLRGGSYEQ
jgi:integrase